jgi:hypothetical protein
MNVSSTLSLLQALATLLMAIHAQPAPASATLLSAVGLTNRSLELVAQANAEIPFSVQANDGTWPNIGDLQNAAYRDANGNWVRLGPSVVLVQEDTSFGDLNGDGLDDAAVVVNEPDASGAAHYFLVAMLNQGGVMFDAAELPLGNSVDITSHRIANGVIELNGNTYQLLGTLLTPSSGS